MRETQTKVIPLKLEDGLVVYVESTVLPGDKDVAFSALPFDDFTKVIGKVTTSILNALKKVSPDKTNIELGFQVSVKSGKLSSVLVQGSGKANIKVTLEWNGK